MGTVAVADPDEYDDVVVGMIDPDLFNTFLSIPLSVAGASNTIQIGFDSSFRTEDSMTGVLDVSFDGGATFANLLTLAVSPSLPSSSLLRANERITFQTARTGDDLVVRFGVVNAGNDWWWAVRQHLDRHRARTQHPGADLLRNGCTSWAVQATLGTGRQPKPPPPSPALAQRRVYSRCAPAAIGEPQRTRTANSAVRTVVLVVLQA